MNLQAKRMAYSLLKHKIKEKRLNYQKLAKELRISESGLNKKINGKNYFTQSEIQAKRVVGSRK